MTTMITWIYTLPGGATGSIRAASDDDAWNAVLAQIGQCPDVLAVADEVAECPEVLTMADADEVAE